MGISNLNLLFPGDDDQPPVNRGLKITQTVNGLFEITGSPPALTLIDATTFSITSPLVTINDDGTYTVASA